MLASPTQRTLAYLREQGYLCYVTEHWNAYAHVRKDLFGFIDICAIKRGERGVLGVQATTGSNLSARVAKAEALTAYRLWLACGNPVMFIGWRKVGARGKRKLWEPLIKRIDLADFL